MGKFYGKPIFSHRFTILFYDFFFISHRIEFLSVFPIDWSMGNNYGTDELLP
jgi:hypothetical protein